MKPIIFEDMFVYYSIEHFLVNKFRFQLALMLFRPEEYMLYGSSET